MSFRNILTWPNPALKKVSVPVTDYNDELISLVRDMHDTLNVVTGVGLAAPQIGEHKRVVIIDMSQCNAENPVVTDGLPENILVMVNPQLKLSGPKHKWVEACLSVPDSRGHVERDQYVSATFNTVLGEEKTIETDWPTSGVLQHECDHLDGILYIDKMGRMSRDMLTKKITKKRKKLAEMRRLMQREEKAELDRLEGKKPSSSTKSTKKRKKRPAKKNHVNKRRRKKK